MSATRCSNRLGEAAEGDAMHIHVHPNGHLALGSRPLEWRSLEMPNTSRESLIRNTSGQIYIKQVAEVVFPTQQTWL